MVRCLFLALIGCALGAVLCMSGTGAEPKAASKTTKPAGMEYGELVIGAPIAFKNLQIFPVSSKRPKNEDRFITLDEGLKSGTVKVVEVGTAPQAQQAASSTPNAAPLRQAVAAPQPQNGAQSSAPPAVAQALAAAEVNRLLVYNTSGKPLLLMPGEVISGGKQDRTIGQELVIESSGKSVPVDVFCVESGRWRGRGAAATTELFAANRSLVVTESAGDLKAAAEKADKGEFIVGVGQLNKETRLAVQAHKNQGKVWEKVAETNAKSGVESATCNFACNYAQSAVTTNLKPYIDACREKVFVQPQVVGVVVAVNGKVQSVDIFASTPLFKKYWDKLLTSYALDALTSVDAKTADKSCSTTACVVFLKEADKAPVTKVETKAKGLRSVRHETQNVIRFSTEHAGNGAKTAPAAVEHDDAKPGALGESVHTGIFAL